MADIKIKTNKLNPKCVNKTEKFKLINEGIKPEIFLICNRKYNFPLNSYPMFLV